MDYQFDVVHLPGMKNILPNRLSRLFHTKKDLEGGNGYINKRETNESQMTKDEKLSREAQLLNETMQPPANERQEILDKARLCGHCGADAIVQIVHNNGLHWPNLKQRAVETVKSCPECQKFNIAKSGCHPLRTMTADHPEITGQLTWPVHLKHLIKATIMCLF